MKIGILTFHRALNYGAVLQCYALQEVLTHMGYYVEVIDYRPDYLEQYRHFFSTYSFKRIKGALNKIKYVISCVLKGNQLSKTKDSFDIFNSRYLRLSNIVHKINDIAHDYDYIVFGSDQIWSPSICEGFDNIYWGNFQHDGIKLITYAASIGGHNSICENQWKLINRYIRNYDAISVREETLQFQLKKHCNIDATLVSDPTILAFSKIFSDIAVNPHRGDYVLLFTLEKEKGAVLFAKNIAKQLGDIPVVKLSSIRLGNDRSDDIEYVSNVNPVEFLGYFKYAKCVVTISFHGTAFSTIFNKDFYCLRSRQMDRANNLLQSLGLEDRVVAPSEMVAFQPVDYVGKNVEQRRVELREKSMRYLKESLQ